MIIHSNPMPMIVLPADATPREQYAAETLQKYLQRIFDGDATVITDDSPAEENCILIGGPERNAITARYLSEAEFDAAVPGPEGLFIKGYKDCLVLAGSSKNEGEHERGTIYAVYEFLERFCGCSFGAIIKAGVPGGEWIPQLQQLDVTDVFYAKPKADVRVRAGVVQYNCQFNMVDFSYPLDIPFIDWLSKNRFNYMRTWSTTYAYLKEHGITQEYERRGILFDVGQHDTIDMLLPQQGNKYFPEPYRQTHPEYYRLESDGSRFVDKPNFFGQLVLCVRNEEMIEQFAKNLNQFLDDNPSVKFCALSMKDGTDDMCHCPQCRKYSKMENYLYWIRKVAKRVAQTHPDVKIDIALYTDIWDPPAWLDALEPNIFVHITAWDMGGLRKAGKPDGSCLNGTHFEDNALRWKKFGIDVGYYDYHMGIYNARQRYLPIADEIQAICRRFVEKDILGIFTQIEIFNLWNNVFNFYTLGRTGYDTDLTMEDNLSRFIRIFGEGGIYVAANIRYAEALLDGQVSIAHAGRWLQENIDKARVYDNFEKALAAAKSPEARNNIRMMRMAFRYSDLETRQPERKKYEDIKLYTIPERGELLYMQRNFDTYQGNDGFGICIPVTGEDNGFVPDKWYLFEH